MAIFHMSFKIISRGVCRYATAAAAYIAGERIRSEYDGRTHHYQHRQDVLHREVMLPDHAPRRFMNRAELWSSVEQVEKSKRAQQARSLEAALPKELNRREQIELVREYLQPFVDQGMCVDWALHDKDKDNDNFHFHALLTMRPLNQDGTWGAKSRKIYELDAEGNKIYDKQKRQYKCHTEKTTNWDNRDNVVKWRKRWADTVNRKLASLGIDQRIDHRSYKEQGIHVIPQIHEGKEARAIYRKTGYTEVSDLNRQIREVNALLGKIRGIMMMIYSSMERQNKRRRH